MDAGGRKLFDTWLGSGTLLLGHGHPWSEVALKMLPDGVPISSNFLQLLSQTVNFEVGGIGFQTSGSSAVNRAVRLVRALSGKSKIAVLGSFWHGSDNEFLFARNKVQISTGVQDVCQSEVQWFETFDDFFNYKHKDDFAALLAEPHQGSDPSVNMLDLTQEQRLDLKERNIYIIADEIISGFRERYGSCSSSRAAAPDIVVFGKAIGLGFPVGVVLASKDCMRMQSKLPFWGGTFSASPTQINIINRALELLLRTEYENIHKNHSELVGLVESIASEYGFSVKTGCSFSRLVRQNESLNARGFMSEKKDFSVLRDALRAQHLYVGHNALMFPSIYSVRQSLRS